MNRLIQYFTTEQMDKIVQLHEEGLLYFNSDKQIEWLDDIIYKYKKFKLDVYCSQLCKDFLSRILSGFYTQTTNDDDWNYKGE